MNKRDRIHLGAHVPEGSKLHRAILKEQAETGQSVAAILRDALAIRYGLKDNGKNGSNANE